MQYLVWKAVNQMAEMIHQEDANHPVITVIGGQYKEILHVADNPSTGGDAEPLSKPIAESVLETWVKEATIHLPEKAGNYRIFAYAHDAQGAAATANLPIRVSEKTE